MRINVKFSIFFGLAVLPLILFWLLNINNAEKVIKTEVHDKMAAVAVVQEHRVKEIIERNIERLQGVSSRTQLRIFLKDYLSSGAPEVKQGMLKIMTDAQNAISDFKEISIVDLSGRVIISTNPKEEFKDYSEEPLFVKGKDNPNLDLKLGEGDETGFYTAGPLTLEGETLGVLRVKSNAASIVSVVKDYTGLGQTGETILAKRGSGANVIFLVPTRFGAEKIAAQNISEQKSKLAAVMALLNTEAFFEDILDYRGQQVLAATRYIEEQEWGMVVKIDKDEALYGLRQIKSASLVIGVIDFFVIILISLLFAESISRPIRQVTKTIEDISTGKLDSGIDPKLSESKDEIGELARAFERTVVSLKLAMRETKNHSSRAAAENEKGKQT